MAHFQPEPEIQLPASGNPADGTLRIEFHTPTEIKDGGSTLEEPSFHPLIERICERIRSLGALYQAWPGDWDCSPALESASHVRTTDWEWTRLDRARRSSRTGQRHGLGGFVGWAEFEGPVGASLPLLEIARWTGVGRQTVWGKGEIRVLAFAPRVLV